MWKNITTLFLTAVILSFVGCKSSFDALLTSTDYEDKYTKAFEYFEEEEYYKAQMLFEQLMTFYRGTEKVEKIYFHYCYTQYHLEKYILASYYFDNFISTYPNTEYSEEAMYMSAFSNYKLSPTYRLDQTYTQQSIDEFQRFINTYPASDKVDQANALINEMRAKQEAKAIAAAELYMKLENYQSAAHSFENVLQQYPDSENAENIRFSIINSSYKLAVNSVYSKRADRYEATIKKCEEFENRYPSSTVIEEVTEIRESSTEQLKKLQ